MTQTTDEAILTEFEKKWEFSDEVGSFQTYRLVDKEKVIAWLRSVLSRIRSQAEADGARKEREKFLEIIGSMEKLPYYARLAQNRNGIDYCSTCEQAWEYCSCSARNTGYKKAIEDVFATLRHAVEKGGGK